MHCFTSITLGYLARARVLAASLATHHPDWRLHLVVAEPLPEWFDIDAEMFDEVHTVADLDIPGGAGWMFQHNVVEACTALKGAALERILQRDDCSAAIYLDPDIALFAPLDSVVTALGDGSVVLTPHQLVPERTAAGAFYNEVTTLVHGTYNLGFLAVRADGVGREFASWWRRRLIDYCYDDRALGLFTDQRWCDLVPAMFSPSVILRDPGCNVGPWNVSGRRIAQAGERFRVNDEPLRFFHFSGFDAPGRAMLRRFASDQPAVFELWEAYGEAVAAHAVGVPGGIAWAYDCFDDGTPIQQVMRSAYRYSAELRARYRDPFWTRSDGDCFLRWWEQVGRHDWIQR